MPLYRLNIIPKPASLLEDQNLIPQGQAVVPAQATDYVRIFWPGWVSKLFVAPHFTVKIERPMTASV